ncbi:hypothetical protein [Psychrobacter sp.]|uniref:hypothetical protein n=1 Tax=Psychrobacter sp. TaxID=56811 RepID=UPI003F9DDF37
MNYGDVFRKSDLGRAEIKSQSLGVLPREARTLLIMIDGKRTYQNYLDTLDNSKMFADFGGIGPLFELLLELECIELVTTHMDAQAQDARQVSATIKAPNTEHSQSAAYSFDASTEVEFERTFNSKQPKDATDVGNKSIGGMFKSVAPNAQYGPIKSDLATYIEKNAPPAEAWGYLLGLEQCEDSAQLLLLAQEIQKSSNSDLSRGMAAFIKRIQP